MKKHIPLSVLILFFISSCQFASFTDRPGVDVRQWPVDMYGTYMHTDRHDGVCDTHVLVVGPQGVEMDDPLISKLAALNDSSHTLSHLGDFYYLNVKETDSLGHSIWFVYPFEYNDKYLRVYKLLLNSKSIRRMKRSGLQPTGRRNGEYRMDNEAFKKYCERYLKPGDALTFKRIKK